MISQVIFAARRMRQAGLMGVLVSVEKDTITMAGRRFPAVVRKGTLSQPVPQPLTPLSRRGHWENLPGSPPMETNDLDVMPKGRAGDFPHEGVELSPN